jgi:BON domain-containing protein
MREEDIMKACLKLSALAAALIAVPAMADVMYIYTPPPATVYAPVEDATTDYVYTTPVTTTTTTYVYDEPRTITVYGYRPANEDERITNDVITNIADDPWINGAVGVETTDKVVTLNGRVGTPGQALRAEYDAHAAGDVSEVQNRLRTRVGGS